MAPRKPKTDEDAASDFTESTTASPLKPKAEKAAKVHKAKGEKVAKPKADKAKIEKVKKAIASIGEDGESSVVKVKKPTSVKETVAEKRGGKEKEKVVTVVGDVAAGLIREYLKEQNRPYSATEVSANLHGKVTKTVADKVLKELAESEQIMSKATKGNEKGSQWVFWAVQDKADNASPGELAAMDEEILGLKEGLPALRSNVKVVGRKLEGLKGAMTTKELLGKIEALSKEVEEKRGRLQGFKSGKVKMVTKEVLEQVEKDFKYWGAKKSARAKAFKELEHMLSEHVKDLWDEAGLEKVED